MKKLNKISITILAIAALVSSSVMADLYFLDTFDNSEAVGNNINFNAYVDGRQFGTKTFVTYSVGAAAVLADTGISGGKLILPPEKHSAIKTSYDFTDSTEFTVEADIKVDTAGTAGDYVTLSVFKDALHCFAFDGITFRFHDNGQYWGIEGTPSGQTVFYTSPGGMFNPNNTIHVKFCVRATDFSNGKISISLYIDGKPMPLDSDGGNVLEYVYTIQNPQDCNQNYLMVGGVMLAGSMLSSTSTVDNLEINSVNSGIAINSWLADADTGINSSKTYTHAVVITNSGDVVVNGVTFSNALTSSGANWNLFDGDTTVALFSNNQMNYLGAMSGGGTNLLIGYAQGSANNDTDIGLHLTGLTPGKENILTIYSTCMGTQKRTVDSSGSDGSAITYFNQNEYMRGTGHVMKLTYKVPSNGELYFSLSPTNESVLGGGWMPRIFAFSNEEIASPTEPSQASGLSFSSVEANQMDVSWTGGDGNGLLVVASDGQASSFVPSDNVTYFADANYGDGERVGSKTVYEGSAGSFSMTGLTPGREYYLTAYEYNANGSERNYNAVSAPANSQLSLATDADVAAYGTLDAEAGSMFEWPGTRGWIGTATVSPISGGNFWFNGPAQDVKQVFAGLKLQAKTQYKVSFDACCVGAAQTIDVGLKYMSGNKYTATVIGDLNSGDVLNYAADATGAAIGGWDAAGRFSCPLNPAPDAPESSHFFQFNTPDTLVGSGTDDLGIYIHNVPGVQVRLDNIKVDVLYIPEPAIFGLLSILGLALLRRK